eukprot:1160706-Pelagomonas_calceolata.AAC.4
MAKSCVEAYFLAHATSCSLRRKSCLDGFCPGACYRALYIETECNVGIKCATITPDEARVKEFNLKKQKRCPQHTGSASTLSFKHMAPLVVYRQPKIVSMGLLQPQTQFYPVHHAAATCAPCVH